MEINEKLDVFYAAAISAAEKQSAEILAEQKKTYQESMEEYEKGIQAGQELGSSIAEAKIRKEVNRKISAQTVLLKKAYHDSREQKKEELFARVEEKLAAYRKTPAYEEFLVSRIAYAEKFADGAEMTVYFDPADSDRMERIAERTGCCAAISDKSFLGGIRAVIPAKNVLIDESFLTRLNREKENFV